MEFKHKLLRIQKPRRHSPSVTHVRMENIMLGTKDEPYLFPPYEKLTFQYDKRERSSTKLSTGKTLCYPTCGRSFLKLQDQLKSWDFILLKYAVDTIPGCSNFSVILLEKNFVLLDVSNVL